jgi:hypothetical protein
MSAAVFHDSISVPACSNLVTLLLSPIGSPCFSDTADGSWWIGFQGLFCFYIIPRFCKPHALLVVCLMLVSCLAYSSALEMEVMCSSKRLVEFRRKVWHYIPEDITLHNRWCENVKSYAMIFYFINPRQRSRYSDWLWAGWPRGWSSISGRVKNFLFSTQPPIQWVPRTFFLGVKRLGREADHSPPASAEVKKMWIYTSTPPHAFMAWCLIS